MAVAVAPPAEPAVAAPAVKRARSLPLQLDAGQRLPLQQRSTGAGGRAPAGPPPAGGSQPEPTGDRADTWSALLDRELMLLMHAPGYQQAKLGVSHPPFSREAFAAFAQLLQQPLERVLLAAVQLLASAVIQPGFPLGGANGPAGARAPSGMFAPLARLQQQPPKPLPRLQLQSAGGSRPQQASTAPAATGASSPRPPRQPQAQRAQQAWPGAHRGHAIVRLVEDESYRHEVRLLCCCNDASARSRACHVLCCWGVL
jgi:hypothetical protein